jgi:hypothetical protein
MIWRGIGSLPPLSDFLISWEDISKDWKPNFRLPDLTRIGRRDIAKILHQGKL